MAKYRVVKGYGPISVWKDPKKRPEPFEDPAQWLSWPDGAVFEPPPHFNVKRGLDRGIIVEVKG